MRFSTVAIVYTGLISKVPIYTVLNLIIISLGLLFSSQLSAADSEFPFDESFYISKICTSYMTKDDFQFCDEGYLLKSETSKEGQVKETILLEDIGSYGWNHIVVNKIDNNTYHVYVSCGNPCGTHMLFGRGGKEQHFDRNFDYDVDSQCSVEYDYDKELWIARRFFSDHEIILSTTLGSSEPAVYPKYDIEFDRKGRVVVKDYFSEKTIETLPNPCLST